jgi:hypothetical protein
MYDYVARFQALLARPDAHPNLQITSRRFSHGSDSPNLLALRAQMLQDDFGFTLAPEDWGLFRLAELIDIGWYCPAPLSPTTPNGWSGGINIVSISSCLRTPHYRLPVHEREPRAEFTYYYDNYAHSDQALPAVLYYDHAQPRYPDVYALVSPYLVPLELSPTQYVAAALDWYGALYWQLLYCSLDEFRQLARGDRQGVYRLGKLLPRLFPETAALIETKRAYFDEEQKDRAVGLLTWEL